MAIKFHLDNLLHERRMTLTEVAGRIGLEQPIRRSSGLARPGRSALSRLEAICPELGWQPGDLLGQEDD